MSTSTRAGPRHRPTPPVALPPILVGESGGIQFRFDMTPGTHVLGRGEDCDYVLADATISRHHAEVEVAGRDVWVRDLKSLNGTFIDRTRITGRGRLTRGGTVRFGHITLSIQDPAVPPTAPVTNEDTASETLATSILEIREHLSHRASQPLLLAMAEAGEILSRHRPREALLEQFFDLLDRHIVSHRILILQPHPDPPGYVVIHSRTREDGPAHPIRMTQRMLQRIFEEGRAIITSEDSGDPDREPSTSVRTPGIRAAIGVPLADNDEIHGAVYVDTRQAGATYRSEDLHLLTLLANMLAVKLTNLRLARKERALNRLHHELVTAARIQRKLLPGSFPRIEGFRAFAHLDPCEEIGGDFYDVRTCRDGRLWITLGDVTGHGITAALLMSHVMAGMQILEDGCCCPIRMVDQLENYLAQHIEDEQFVALFTGLLDPATGQLDYVNAGQPPPALLGPKGMRWLETTGPPVALLEGGPARTKATCILDPGCTLLAYSDGISEIRNGTEEYGDRRMPAFLEDAHALPPEALVRELLDDALEYRSGGPTLDDLTMMAIKRDERLPGAGQDCSA